MTTESRKKAVEQMELEKRTKIHTHTHRMHAL